MKLYCPPVKYPGAVSYRNNSHDLFLLNKSVKLYLKLNGTASDRIELRAPDQR